MVFDLSEVTGLGDFTKKVEKERTLYFVPAQSSSAVSQENPATPQEISAAPKAFLVVNKNTIEVRTDQRLANLLKEKYESVMESRYFGRGGIEIVLAGQLSRDELNDLVRLSYRLTTEEN